ncbi:hypothetical protein [Paenisporosarcina quisquiliarum]
MTKFINDFVGAISDIVKSICYFLFGALIVGVLFFLLAKFFEWIF